MDKPTVTDSQIRDLIQEAAAAGDSAQVDLCHAALRGVRAARASVEKTILNTRARDERDEKIAAEGERATRHTSDGAWSR